jgi:hypothetical protein
MNSSVAANDHVVLDDGVPAEYRSLRKNDVIGDLAVVSRVGGVHEEVVITDSGWFLIMDRTMDGGMLSEDVSISDQRSRSFGIGIEIQGLWCDAERGERPDIVVFADDHRALHKAMGPESRPPADSNRALKHAVGADFHVVRKFNARVKYGCWVDP